MFAIEITNLHAIYRIIKRLCVSNMEYSCVEDSMELSRDEIKSTFAEFRDTLDIGAKLMRSGDLVKEFDEGFRWKLSLIALKGSAFTPGISIQSGLLPESFVCPFQWTNSKRKWQTVLGGYLSEWDIIFGQEQEVKERRRVYQISKWDNEESLRMWREELIGSGSDLVTASLALCDSSKQLPKIVNVEKAWIGHLKNVNYNHLFRVSRELNATDELYNYLMNCPDTSRVLAAHNFGNSYTKSDYISITEVLSMALSEQEIDSIEEAVKSWMHKFDDCPLELEDWEYDDVKERFVDIFNEILYVKTCEEVDVSELLSSHKRGRDR